MNDAYAAPEVARVDLKGDGHHLGSGRRCRITPPDGFQDNARLSTYASVFQPLASRER